MEQAFVLPTSGGLYAAEMQVHDEIRQTAFWRSVLDKLSDRKMGWGELQSYLVSDAGEILLHPLVRAVDRKGQTLLHLAVLQDRVDWVEVLGRDVQLRQKRNHLGLSALELAQLLYRESCMAILDSNFPQLNVTMEEVKGDFSYIRHPIFEHEEIFESVLQQTEKARLLDLIPAEKMWMGVYFDQEIQAGASPKVSIRYINREIGFGAFTEKKIPACSFVGEYTGIIKERNKRLLKDKIYSVRYAAWQAGRKQFTLDAETHGNYTRFINHSSAPNLTLHSVYWRGLPRMIFISLKEIPEGAQLTFDYGRAFWKEMKREPECLF